MKRLCVFALFALVGMVTVAAAQAPAAAPADPLSATLKALHDGVARNMSEAAEKMPEANYAFKPTPEVRSFGELLGHVANSEYGSCSRVKGEKNPNDGNDFEKLTVRADLVKGLKAALAYCDAVYGSLTDAKAMAAIQAIAPATPPAAGQKPAPPPPLAARVLISSISHVNEHYGNVVTYMRLKGLVPPSTERAQQMRR